MNIGNVLEKPLRGITYECKVFHLPFQHHSIFIPRLIIIHYTALYNSNFPPAHKTFSTPEQNKLPLQGFAIAAAMAPAIPDRVKTTVYPD